MELQYQFHDYQSVATTTKYKVLPIAVLITKPLTDFILYYWLQVNMDAIKIKAYWAGQARMTNLLQDMVSSFSFLSQIFQQSWLS